MNKTKIAAATAVAVLGSLLLASTAFAAATTVGNPAIGRATVDTYSNFTIIDTNNPVSASGTLNTFNYYASNLNSFEFVLVDTGNVVKYVSSIITPPGTGAQAYSASVPVSAGWNLGVHFDSTGTVPFDYVGASAIYTPNNNGTPVVGSTLNVEGMSGRTYSWNAAGITNLIVDDNKVECPTASFTTIQAAVTAANAGDTITVCAGTYPEHVAINKALTLNGPNVGIAGNAVRAAEAVIDGTDTGAPFALTANGVTINGFKIINGSAGGLYSGIWSQTGTMDSSVLNNIITNNDFGVWAQCGGNCLIQGNLFDGNNKPGSGSASISADNTAGLTINNNEFKNDTAGNPILLQAVAAGAHTNVVISNNSFHNNANSNIYAVGVTGANIHDNTITPAADATGISLSGADVNVTITKNVITGGARGIRVEDAGYGLGANSAITVNRNNVSSDTGYGVGNTDSTIASLNATCNWWGAVSGPGPVGPGTGSPVTTNVNYSTWLTSADLTNGLCNGGAVPPPVVPSDKNSCMNNGWKTLKDSSGNSFKNQGDCVSFVATKGRNKGAGN